MSIIKSIKQVLGLGPAAENHFWDGSVANQLSLKRGTPDAPGIELIKALDGVLSFPNQGQSLSANGYVKLPGGLIIQWGQVGDAGNTHPVTFPIQFPNTTLLIMCSALSGGSSSVPVANTGFTLVLTEPGATSFSWIAIGY